MRATERRGRTLRVVRRGPITPIEFRTRCNTIGWMQFMEALLRNFDGGGKHLVVEQERK